MLFWSNGVDKLSRKIFCYNKLVWSRYFPNLFFLFIIVILKNIFSHLIFLSPPFWFWCLSFCWWQWFSGCCRLCYHTCPALPLLPCPTGSWGGGVAPSGQTPSFSARQKLLDPAEFRIQGNSLLLQEAAPACRCWAQGRGSCAIHSQGELLLPSISISGSTDWFQISVGALRQEGLHFSVLRYFSSLPLIKPCRRIFPLLPLFTVPTKRYD